MYAKPIWTFPDSEKISAKDTLDCVVWPPIHLVSKTSRAEPSNLCFSKSNLYEIRFLAKYPSRDLKLKNLPFQTFFTHDWQKLVHHL